MKRVLLGLVLIISSIGIAVAANDQPQNTNNLNAKPLAANNILVKTPRIQLMQNDTNAAQVFMELSNQSGSPIALIAANSMTANQTLLQRMHRNDSEQAAMRSISRIVIRPHGDTNLQSHGLYVMLNGLKQSLRKGDSVPVLLIFGDGSSLTVHAIVG